MAAESAQSVRGPRSPGARPARPVRARRATSSSRPRFIQPADVFLDQIGEQVRGRTYVFTDLAGEELCLRPDLTVPVSRLYLERHPRADERSPLLL